MGPYSKAKRQNGSICPCWHMAPWIWHMDPFWPLVIRCIGQGPNLTKGQKGAICPNGHMDPFWLSPNWHMDPFWPSCPVLRLPMCL